MSEVDAYTEWFNNADTDGSTMVSIGELSSAMKGKGYARSQVEAIFNTADTSGDNKMSLEEFLVCMGACDPKVHRAANMKALCRSFDANNDGRIDKEELRSVINEGRGDGCKMTDEEADRLMEMVDANEDGYISYNELLKQVFGYEMDD